MIPNSQSWLVVTSGGLQTLIQERISVNGLLVALSSQELAAVFQERTGTLSQEGEVVTGAVPHTKMLWVCKQN